MTQSSRSTNSSETYASGGVSTPIGRITVVASHRGVHNVTFPNGGHLNVQGMHIHDDADHPVVARALDQLREYFDGTRTSFDLPLDLEGTEFQVAAWKALCEVPFGATASYKQQAHSIGRPTATRAVGAANGRNPVAIVLPCHRIVGADGSLTGFGGGLASKQWLLEHEQNIVRQKAQK